MNMSPYTFTVKQTPRGWHYVIVTIGKDVIYVTRKAYRDGEQALSEAREYIRRISHETQQSTGR